MMVKIEDSGPNLIIQTECIRKLRHLRKLEKVKCGITLHICTVWVIFSKVRITKMYYEIFVSLKQYPLILFFFLRNFRFKNNLVGKFIQCSVKFYIKE